MLDVIGATLSSATAIAVSPIPIVAVILMLMTPRATRLGLAFLLGWVVGILVATTAFALLAGVLPESGSGGPQPILAVILLVLGLGLLLLAVRQWRSRPQSGTTPELPAWMAKIDDMRVPGTIGLAFALAAINPKNLLVAASAGALIGHAGLPVAELIGTIAIFTVIAALSVLVPVLAAVVAPKAAATALTAIRTWLTQYNAVIMTVVLTILGMNVIGNGLGMFS